MPGPGEFVPARACAAGALGALLARQPLTPAKVAFAWQMAVGPALARHTSATCDAGVVRVRSVDARWIREIERSRDLILERLRRFLGDHIISELLCESPSSSARSAFPPENSSAR